jgi:V-type H+-transporting ATPase subunit A
MWREKLVGKIISLEQNPARIQFSEKQLEICRLAAKTLHLSGLGVMGNISDDIKRPLKDISGQTGSVFIPRIFDANGFDLKCLLLFVTIRCCSFQLS